MEKFFTRHFKVVPPTVTELYKETDYTWNYGDFILTAYFFSENLAVIWVSDPEDCEGILVYSWEEDADTFSDSDCVALLSGVREAVVSTLRDIHSRKLRESKGLAAVLKLIDAE